MSQENKPPTHDFPSETKAVLDTMREALNPDIRDAIAPIAGVEEYYDFEEQHEARLRRESWDRTTAQLGAEPPEE